MARDKDDRTTIEVKLFQNFPASVSKGGANRPT